jgi:hypothetical protein
MKKSLLKIVFTVFAIPSIALAQLPVIKAVGGGGRNVNWPLIKKNEGSDGPGYFYNDCAQGVKPTKASSTLAGQGNKNYNVKNVNDNNPMSAWVEGKADYGIGESFEIKAAGVNLIHNGYQSSPKNWLENSRVKRFKVYKNNSPICFLDLTDEMGGQRFELPGHNNYNAAKEFVFKFEIVDVYKGTKWPDVAISEIDVVLCCFTESTIINTASNSTSISDIKSGDSIYSVDLKTGGINSTQVEKISKQTHLSVLKLATENKQIELTFDHPLYIKDFGFSSISRYMQTKNITSYEELIGKVELMVLNEDTNQIAYEKITSIELSKGVFETYSIRKLSTGNTFIANGFVTKVY